MKHEMIFIAKIDTDFDSFEIIPSIGITAKKENAREITKAYIAEQCHVPLSAIKSAKINENTILFTVKEEELLWVATTLD